MQKVFITNLVSKVCRLFLLSCFTFTSLIIGAQTDSLRAARANPKIDVNKLTGKWLALIPDYPPILFRNRNNQFVEMEGIRHGVGPYQFQIDHDSVSAKGIAINWPPYDCFLVFQEPDLLEIHFFTFHSTQSRCAQYRRE